MCEGLGLTETAAGFCNDSLSSFVLYVINETALQHRNIDLFNCISDDGPWRLSACFNGVGINFCFLRLFVTHTGTG